MPLSPGIRQTYITFYDRRTWSYHSWIRKPDGRTIGHVSDAFNDIDGKALTETQLRITLHVFEISEVCVWSRSTEDSSFLHCWVFYWTLGRTSHTLCGKGWSVTTLKTSWNFLSSIAQLLQVTMTTAYYCFQVCQEQLIAKLLLSLSCWTRHPQMAQGTK